MDLKTALERAQELDRQRGTVSTNSALAQRAAAGVAAQQAAQQSAAAGYIREGSFRLDVNFDHFLYESTTRRKIEDDTQKK